MTAYNRIILVGRLTRDPEIKFSTSGTQIANFSLAVDRDYKQEGADNVDFINIVAFGKKAEFAGNYLHKGQLVLIEGRLQIDRWKDKEGQNRSVAKVVADKINFMESKKNAEQQPVASDPGSGEDITFFGSDNGGGNDSEIPF